MHEHASFGAWIQRRRKALDLTQAELAERVGCALGTIRKIETDERRPSKQIAARLAEQLRLPPDMQEQFVKAARAEVGPDRLDSPNELTLPVATAARLPRGTVTFLFSDIEGSAQLWDRQPQAMQAAVERQQALLHDAVVAARGLVFKSAGEAVCAAFASAHDAVTAGLAAQRAFQAEAWGLIGWLGVRIALHTGVVEQRGGDYIGLPVARAARLLSAGRGGQILLSLATEQLVREQLPRKATLSDLGLHRLKDLSLPERIFQLTAPDLASRSAPLATLDAHQTNLPAQATPLIGRGREIAELTALLRRPDVRLVTLSGPGGAGKTRLALQAAAELLDGFTDGNYFVNLAPIGDPNLVATTIAHVLGVAEIANRPVEERLIGFLRARRTLLLLDNFEQVLEAAPLVARLLTAAPQLKVLVTSRATLHLYGEHEFAVPPLALPPAAGERWLAAGEQAAEPRDTVTQYESVRLFIARAQAAKADFTITNENAPAVAEICYRLDGLPLAIELAAARVKFFPPEALLARLERRMQVLMGGPRDLPLRQQTLRNTIDWSYNLLNPDEQALFRRLGIFVAGCTLAAAAAVCDAGDQSLDLVGRLASLADKSLLQHAEGLDGEPRFMMLETIREYALERVAAGEEAQALRQRHAEYYLALAERWWKESHGAAEVALFDQFERELGNLRAALDWSRTTEGAAAINLRLATALVQFWVVRGYASEGWERMQAALEQRSQVPAALRAYALSKVALFPAHFGGDPGQVMPFIEEGLALEQMLGDRQGIAWQLMAQGSVAAHRGDYRQARQLNEQSLGLYQALDDTWGMSISHFQLGELALLAGEHERARALLEQSLALCRQSIGTTWAIARRLTWLGLVMLAQGDSARAGALLLESLTLCCDSRDKVDIPMALVGLAAVAQAQGRPAAAAQLLGAAEALGETSGSYRGLTGGPLTERTTAAVRAQLAEATFAAMWAEGQKLTPEQARRVALGDSKFA